MPALVLYQPDIPQNAAAMMRLCACLGVEVHVIDPAGFDLSDRALRRAGMDYLERVSLSRHLSWEEFAVWRRKTGCRLVLLTTRASTAYVDFSFRDDDLLLVGRESAGVPEAVHEVADALLIVPMAPGLRSLNVATAAAIVLGEALRQTGGFPK